MFKYHVSFNQSIKKLIIIDMKNTLLISFIIVSLIGCTSGRRDKLTRFVYDYEDVLNEEQENKFNDLFKKFEDKTSNEFVLVTTDTYGNEEGIVSYANQFCNINGIGNPDKENWVVMVFSKKNSQIWMTTGTGIEKEGKDEMSQMIIDSIMLPQFKEENYFDGLWSGSNKIIEFVEKPEDEI
jgi:uncharacterized protein